jgi:hypothetical protein
MDTVQISGKFIFIAVFSIVMGAGIVLIWSINIVGGRFDDMDGFFDWKNDVGEKMWTHILAELITALLLMAGGVGLLFPTAWAYVVTAFALGALAYTSLNSLGWALARRDRYPYVIPMSIGLSGGIVCLVMLLL